MSDAGAENDEKERPPSIVGWGVVTPADWEPVWVAWSSRGLVKISWEQPGPVQVATVPSSYADPLLSYFAGQAVDLNAIVIDLHGTVFQRKVWGALRKVAYGTVRTYAGIAHDVGSPRAMRAVGSANGSNPLPIVVPCHRIVEAGLKLGGYSGGLERKRRLLEIEGVRISGDVVQPGQLKLL